MDKQQIANAIAYLVNSRNFATLVRELRAILDQWDARPLVYAGGQDVLNVLIDVGVMDRAAFDKLVALAETKRAGTPSAKRVDYQRILMQERRARIALAVELHERTTGVTLTPAARKKFANEQQTQWRKDRDALLASKGALDPAARSEVIAAFWERVDTQLQQEVEMARGAQHRRAGRRVVVVEQPQPFNKQLAEQLQRVARRR